MREEKKGWGAPPRRGIAAAAAVLACIVLIAVLATQGAPEQKKVSLMNVWRPETTGQTESALEQLLRAEGVFYPMAPGYRPGSEAGFGELKEYVTLLREEEGERFRGTYRDERGRGYLVEIRRRRDASTGAIFGLGGEETEEYVVEGVSYYIAPRDGGVCMSWVCGALEGRIQGDLDTAAAERLACSIRAWREPVYALPEGNRTGEETLSELLQGLGLPGEAAPGSLGEGFRLLALNHAQGERGAQMVHAMYLDEAAQRERCVHLEWWESEEAARSPVFVWNGDGVEEYERGGTVYRILNIGTGEKDAAERHVLMWQDASLWGYVSGDMSAQEAREIADSIAPAPAEGEN